jgi:hypothetical protein
MWYYFNFNPTKIIKYPLKELPEKIESLSASIIKDIKEEFSKIKTQDVSIFIKTDEVLWDKELALWILIDTPPKLINVYEVLDNILNSIFKCVNSSPNSQLNRFLFDLHWPSIVVIPVLNGKCITGKGWRFDSTVLLFGGKEGLGWWNYIMKYLPQASLKELNLRSWDMDVPTAWIEVMEFVSQISLMVKHLRSLNNITELDSMGKQITQRHFQAIIDKVSERLSALNTIFPIILDDINRLISDQGISDNINNSAQLMGEVWEKVNPIKQGNDGTMIKIDMDFVIEWSDKLEKASNCAALSYLFRLFQENHLGNQSDQNSFIDFNADNAGDSALPS